MTTYPMPVLADEELASARARLEDADVRLLSGSVVDPAGVIRAKHVPAQRAGAFHVSGMGASPSWNVFCVDNAIAFTPRFGVVGDLRLRADLTALRVLGEGLAWAPAEMFDQSGAPAPVCTRGLLRGTVAGLAERGLDARLGCELEMVLTPRSGPGWNAYGLGALLDIEPFVLDLLAAADRAGLPIEQLHAEYGDSQLEFSISPTDPLTAADHVVLARLLACRVARRHDVAVSFSPLPFAGGSGNGAHQHLSLSLGGAPLLSGGTGPYGLTDDGSAALGGIVAGLPELTAVFAGSVLSQHRLQPGHWSGAFACWGWENREAAVRLLAATPGNPHGASVELKCIDPSANPYLAAAAFLGLALEGLAESEPLPPEVTVAPAELTAEEAARTGTVRLPADQASALEALESSDRARRLLGEEILEALMAVRRYELETYGGKDVEAVAEKLRYSWSA
ncbi:glutamine synthetase family protein [Pseudonocardia sp. DSM 110487]|uniref:glutamine synthetase family protein n=1 Tax=Pseudonocardia sp. DSM 110487 TaxID=2865833 RepID=UPI002107B366|nr:glutamine synthetase family protein [Pseudonocardia sp. DSM 110487]